MIKILFVKIRTNNVKRLDVYVKTKQKKDLMSSDTWSWGRTPGIEEQSSDFAG